ncbi:MAG: tetratricopeptide repeat protein [Verrucomicrobiota bacterium]
MPRNNYLSLPGRLVVIGIAILITGCATTPNPARTRSAKSLFESTAREYHFPSAIATSTERERLLAEAATGYERLLRQYPDQDDWCAKALRSLGNVRAEQGKLDVAVKLYASVAEKYSRQDWEVLQAWKTAADLLWEAGRQDEAKKFYRKIIARFDQPNAAEVVKSVVRAARWHLATGNANS